MIKDDSKIIQLLNKCIKKVIFKFFKNRKNSNKKVVPNKEEFIRPNSSSSYGYNINDQRNISKPAELSLLREQSSVQLKADNQQPNTKEQESIIVNTTETNELFNRLFWIDKHDFIKQFKKIQKQHFYIKIKYLERLNYRKPTKIAVAAFPKNYTSKQFQYLEYVFF